LLIGELLHLRLQRIDSLDTRLQALHLPLILRPENLAQQCINQKENPSVDTRPKVSIKPSTLDAAGMAKDGSDELLHLQRQLEKRVLNDQISKSTPVLPIFAVENLATTLNCGRHDERVVPCELITSRHIQSTAEKPRRRMYQQQWSQGSVPVSLDLFETHRSPKRFPRDRNKLLRNLVADHPGTARERLRYKILSLLSFLARLHIKGIDEDVRV
jgi:hypothetical protein